MAGRLTVRRCNKLLYIIGQIFGIIATACCIVVPLCKKKWQMLVISGVANLFVAINFFLLNDIGSAIILNLVAIVQIGLSLWHLKKGSKITVSENIIFLVAYIICGVLGFKKAIDVLPIMGGVVFMVAVFQKDEQKTRKLSMLNAILWLVYDALIFSSAAFAQVATICMTSIALYKNRKRKYEK